VSVKVFGVFLEITNLISRENIGNASHVLSASISKRAYYRFGFLVI
jgi:hypothetical protein